MTREFDVPVVLVGGGPVGYALAIELAGRGIETTLLERTSGTTELMRAKAQGLDERSMEHFRRWGLSERLAAVSFPTDYPGDNVYCTSVTGDFMARQAVASIADSHLPVGSSEKRNTCPQWELDRLLATVAQERGLTHVRNNARFERLSQDSDGVTSEAIDTVTGEHITLRSQYLVACDGAGSAVRRGLDIPFEGPQLDYSLGITIRLPRLPDLPENMTRATRYLFVDESGIWGNLTFMDGHDVWRLTLLGAQERLEDAEHSDEAAVRRALGSDDVPFEILGRVPWRRTQCVAKTYNVGRVLLAGDSAHTMSPTGGHGLNTGLGDVSDLGWMMEGVLNGWATPEIFDAYTAERRPVAQRNGGTSTKHFLNWVAPTDFGGATATGEAGDKAREKIGQRLVEALQSEFHSPGIALGFNYDGSPLIVEDGTPAPPDEAGAYVPSARPGHRAPHIGLADGTSLLRLFGDAFVLLHLGSHETDTGEFERLAKESGIPFRVETLDEPDVSRMYERNFVLVRPDGHVAWRDDTLPSDMSSVVSTVRGAALPTTGSVSTAPIDR